MADVIHEYKPTLSVIDIDEIHSTVHVKKEIVITWPVIRDRDDICDIAVIADDVIIVWSVMWGWP